MLNTAFFGSSVYVLPVLEALRTSTHLRLIVSQPDKPVGRSQTVQPAPPQAWAKTQHIDVLTPASLLEDKDQIVMALKKHSIDSIVVADYGLLIPREIFDFPKWKTINIHFSRLPDLAGPSPVQWTILRGDPSAWISFMQIVEELDAGPILSQHEFRLQGFETTEQLYTNLFVKAASLLPQILRDYTTYQLTPKPQNQTFATFTRHLTRDDGFVPFDILIKALQGKPEMTLARKFFPDSSFMIHDSFFIDRLLRAFTPWPGVWTVVKVKSFRLKILKAHAEGEKLVVDEVQLEGKRPIKWPEFLRAYREIL